MMGKQLDLQAMWPELFAGLTDEQRSAVERPLVANWHEGWKPNREDVENLADYVRGAIDFDEYTRRGMAAITHHTQSGLYE